MSTVNYPIRSMTDYELAISSQRLAVLKPNPKKRQYQAYSARSCRLLQYPYLSLAQNSQINQSLPIGQLN